MDKLRYLAPAFRKQKSLPKDETTSVRTGNADESNGANIDQRNRQQHEKVSNSTPPNREKTTAPSESFPKVVSDKRRASDQHKLHSMRDAGQLTTSWGMPPPTKTEEIDCDKIPDDETASLKSRLKSGVPMIKNILQQLLMERRQRASMQLSDESAEAVASKPKQEFTPAALAFAAQFKGLLNQDGSNFKRNLCKISLNPHLIKNTSATADDGEKPKMINQKKKETERQKKRRKNLKKAVSIAMAMGSLYDWTKIVTSRDPLTQMRKCKFIRSPRCENEWHIKVRDQFVATVLVTKKERQRLEELVNWPPLKRRHLPPLNMSPVEKPVPTRRPVRPSSASANLQSHDHYKSGLFDNRRPTTAAPVERPKTGVPKAHHWRGGSETEEIDRIKLQRRPTLSTLEGLEESDVPRAGTNNASAGDLLKSKIEEKINIDTLELLKQAFQEADEDGSGELDLDEFKILLKSKLNLAGTKDQQIDALFYKIDWSSDGNITWDEFCTYMQLEYAEKEDSYQRSKDVMFHLPAKTENMPHRDSILKITDTDGTFIACSQDGIVSFWDQSLRLKRTRTVVPNDPNIKQNKQKWITDFCIMTQFNKIIIGTGDREIQFFELSSFEPYCQISLLETVPLHMDFCSTGPDECIILYGDTNGCVNILSIKGTGECLRTWKKRPKQSGIATVSLNDAARGNNHVEFISWKVHTDWVQELRYYHEIRQVISCSNSTNSAMVIGCTAGSTNVEGSLREIKDQGSQNKIDPARIIKKDDASYFSPRTRLDADQSVFKVYKGVKTFAFSKSKNVIVTGGMDRIVRMWNPYVPTKPVALLRGHNAPIFYLFIAPEENRVFSISTDKCVKIWDIQDQNCLLTVRPKGHKIRGDLQACHYSHNNKSLAVATDQMALLNLKLKPVLHADIVITHKEPVTSAKYNGAFRQVLTCSEGSIVKLWDFETGNTVFDFGEAHGESAITCLDFDTTGRRCLTGGRDGGIKIWNYNNGHCLMTLRNREGNDEICGLTYVEMNKNRYVVGVGWDRCINIYCDEPNDTGLHQLVDPQERWEDDKKNGHKEDILSIAFCPPNLLATSSYDGEVIIWNMVSGHIFCHLKSPPDPDYVSDSLDGDSTVNQVVFMKTRAYNKDAASLIASGPRGSIHFWNVFSGGRLLAKFKGSKHSNVMITTLVLNGGDQVLYSGDNFGFVHCWNVSDYALTEMEKAAPELLTTWRAHVEIINSLDFIDEHKLLITASNDCSVRLWNKDGDYIGTFGQPEPWDIYNVSTWQHPMAPFDVLVDPMSMPEHPVIEGKINTHQVVHEDSAANSDGEEEIQREIQARLNHARQTFHVDDATIAKQLKERSFTAPPKVGKRLRHEKLKHNLVDRGGPSEYQMLRCYDLTSCPQPEPPQLKINKNNPFDFYSAEDVGA